MNQSKQNSEVLLSHSLLADLSTGDNVTFQFASSETTVSLVSHATYGDHPESAKIIIIKMDN